MQWSYDLLSSTQLRVFARLSVFAGSFSLERSPINDLIRTSMALLEVTLTAILGQPEMERLAEEARDLDLAALLDLAEAHH